MDLDNEIDLKKELLALSIVVYVRLLFFFLLSSFFFHLIFFCVFISALFLTT